jgi:hypothetical protein
MIKCIENIKIEIKQKSIKKNNKEEIQYIEKVINWYKKLPSKYKKRTENGVYYAYPDQLHILVSKRLNKAYETIINLLTILDLI